MVSKNLCVIQISCEGVPDLGPTFFLSSVVLPSIIQFSIHFHLLVHAVECVRVIDTILREQ